MLFTKVNYRCLASGHNRLQNTVEGVVSYILSVLSVHVLSENSLEISFSCMEKPSKSSFIQQGCDCAANWLILANSDPNFVITEISVNQVRKCFPALGVEVFPIQEQPFKCHNCRRFLRILANFALGQSHP